MNVVSEISKKMRLYYSKLCVKILECSLQNLYKRVCMKCHPIMAQQLVYSKYISDDAEEEQLEKYQKKCNIDFIQKIKEK